VYEARAVAVAAFPVVLWFNVGTSAATMALKLGTPDEPFGAAKKLLAAALDRVNDSAGVEVGVPTVVVNRGDKLPAEKDVTVPPPPDGHV
jgi:hypothetical protein